MPSVANIPSDTPRRVRFTSRGRVVLAMAMALFVGLEAFAVDRTGDSWEIFFHLWDFGELGLLDYSPIIPAVAALWFAVWLWRGRWLRRHGGVATAEIVSLRPEYDSDENVALLHWTYEYRAKGERFSDTKTETLFRKLGLERGSKCTVFFDKKRPKRNVLHVKPFFFSVEP